MTVEENSSSVQADPKAEEQVKSDATFGDKEPKAPAAAPKVEDKKVETQENSAPKNVVPEKYDFKVPEGSLLSPEQLEALAAYSKEKQLTNEQAQGLLDREHQAIASYVENQKQELAKKPDAWLAEAQADKEIGGGDFGKNAEVAKRVLAVHGSDALKKILNDTGLGNHPELLRTFVRIGKAMSEDSLVLPGAQAGGEKRIQDIFYPPKNEGTE